MNLNIEIPYALEAALKAKLIFNTLRRKVPATR